MRLSRRLLSAERALGGPKFVTWAEMHAASERLRTILMAKMRAMLDGSPEPVVDLKQREADTELINRWRRQEGIPDTDREAIAKKLREHLRQMSGNPRWDWTDARRSSQEQRRESDQSPPGEG